ncbi:cilia- and flagella-associated protein 45-like [Bradysia coprophila]|uniref:cilia- and flagella-associated protein 45-like n=1 Tax=Bradysia coprophila TaxID=38358 RepID=UPI00187DC3C9|nr:cilia- and flagella-associated protein 45-like [Bradysia coprophila]
MRRSKTASASSRNTAKNFVKEGSTYKVNKQPDKQILPGTYSMHPPSKCEKTINGRSIHLKREKCSDRNELLKIISQENVRDLLVPLPPVAHPSIFPAKEIHRMKTEGNEYSEKERLARVREYEVNKKRLEEECERRKMLMKEMDKMKEEKRKCASDIPESESIRGKILDRAFLAQHEQTEEIQRANRLILATKCHVIRDAQIAEKYEIEREIREEDNRLDKMMLEERDKALKLVDINEMKQKIHNAKVAEELKVQLHQRELAKLLEAERIEEEAKKITKAIIATNKQKQKIKEELEKFKELSEYLKNVAFEEQRIADMKSQEYMRAKQARDKAVLRERQLKLEQQQREADALLKLQTQMLDTKNEREEMNLRRNQEEKEREFRRREKEAAIKRKALEKELERVRAAQLKELEKAKAIELTRDKMEFDIALEKLKFEEAKEKEKREKSLKEQEKYRIEITNQMKQKQIEKKEKQRRERIEFINEQEKERERVKNIQTIIKAKINGMREAKIPEKFVKGCERQLQSTT